MEGVLLVLGGWLVGVGIVGIIVVLYTSSTKRAIQSHRDQPAIKQDSIIVREPDTVNIQVSYGPLKRAFATLGLGFGMGAAVGGIFLMQLLGVIVACAFAYFLWWLSDLGYEITWLLGFPLRLFAFIATIGAIGTILGAIIKLLVVIVATVIALTQTALGRSD